MAKRKIITIDPDICNGCGQCIPNCPEGALQLIDGKARLISDLFCDGLGACIGHCPLGAITIEEREAEPYDEMKVMVNIIKGGPNVIKAHLEHLKSHGEKKYLKQAFDYLKINNIGNPLEREEVVMPKDEKPSQCGCPGAAMIDFSKDEMIENVETGERQSQLKQWPVQLHLVPPNAPYFQGKDVVLSADCVAYSYADFHKDFLKGKSLAIACPKLDEGQETYVEKITSMIDGAKINTLTVLIMEVPCCRGLLQIAQQGLAKAKRKIPIKTVVMGLQGRVLKEEWLQA